MTPEQATALTTVVDWASRLTVMSFLVTVVIGFIREWWVPGSVYRRRIAEDAERLTAAVEETRMWRDVALDNLDLAKRGTGVAEKLSGSTS